MKSARALLSLCTLIALAACSGNSSGGAENALPNASQPVAQQDVPPQAQSPETNPQATPPDQNSPEIAPVAQTPEVAPPPKASTRPRAKMQAAAATPMPMVTLHPGEIIGQDDQFTPVDGDASNGGHGGAIDGLTCNATMTENKYHVHLYLGLLVNGKQIAIPDAIGLNQPGAETSTHLTNTAQCYYNMHTHDASGMIHIEANSTASLGSAIYNLGYLIDIWGQKLTSTNFGRYSGSTRIYYATTPLRNLYSGTYQQYTGTTPRAIKLYSHEAIWIEVGPTFVPAAQLPKVQFYTEY